MEAYFEIASRAVSIIALLVYIYMLYLLEPLIHWPYSTATISASLNMIRLFGFSLLIWGVARSFEVVHGDYAWFQLIGRICTLGLLWGMVLFKLELRKIFTNFEDRIVESNSSLPEFQQLKDITTATAEKVNLVEKKVDDVHALTDGARMVQLELLVTTLEELAAAKPNDDSVKKRLDAAKKAAAIHAVQEEKIADRKDAE